MNDKSKSSVTTKIIHCWLMRSPPWSGSELLFPMPLYEEIEKYCNIMSVLGFICGPEKVFRLAQALEKAERYTELMELMFMFVKFKSCSYNCDQKEPILSRDQRDLLSVAFKNALKDARASWRVMNAEIDTLTKDNDAGGDDLKALIVMFKGYRRIIAMEVKETCLKMHDLMQNYVIKTVEQYAEQHDNETSIFYMKMTGDCNRYLAEIFGNAEYKENAEKYYGEAWRIGQMMCVKDKFYKTHPTFLGLGLNYAVYSYDIAKEREKASNIAQSAVDMAMEVVNSGCCLGERPPCFLIISLLKDNLNLWANDAN
eukprot:81113_1